MSDRTLDPVPLLPETRRYQRLADEFLEREVSPAPIASFARARGFLYRRLAALITCQIKLLGRHPLLLDSKFQVNSLQDVFCHPFYWQVYGWLKFAPKLIVDLGAHCGHFSMLADVCFRTQFQAATPEYILVEPNPRLVSVIRRNLDRSRLCPCHRIHCGLVGGPRSGPAQLWVSPRNYLSASLAHRPNTRGVSADFFDLESLVKNRAVDLLKVDIEGAEFDFVEQYQELLGRTQAVVIELHDAAGAKQERLFSILKDAGLKLRSTPIRNPDSLLAMFQRW